MTNSACVLLAPFHIGCSIFAHFINDADMFFQKKKMKCENLIKFSNPFLKTGNCIIALIDCITTNTDCVHKLHKIASIYKYLFHVLLFEIFVNKKKNIRHIQVRLVCAKKHSAVLPNTYALCSRFAFTFPHNHSTEQKSIIHRK